MSQSPLRQNEADVAQYMDNWNALALRIKRGQSFSGREPNRCFLNTRDGTFADVSAVTGFDFADDGRGIATTDWDHDGDLDFWIMNRTGPRVRLLLNQLTPTHSNALAIRLLGVRCNQDAIGARVALRVEGEKQPIVRTLRAGDGFASQSSKWVHFGIGPATRIEQLTIHWPGDDTPQRIDGKTLDVNARYRVTQGQASPELVSRFDERLRSVNLVGRVGSHELPSTSIETQVSPRDPARIVLSQPRTLPPLTFQPMRSEADKESQVVAGKSGAATLLVLWASWCRPCISELDELNQRHAELASAGLHVVALSTDSANATADIDGAANNQSAALELVDALQPTFQVGFASDAVINGLVAMEHQTFYRQRDLALPYALLLDDEGRVNVIYRGKLPLDTVVKDLKLQKASASARLAAARPLGGRQIAHWLAPTPLNFAKAYFEAEAWSDAAKAVEEALAQSSLKPDQQLQAWKLCADIEQQRGDVLREIVALRECLKRQPDDKHRQIRLAVRLHSTSTREDASEAERIVSQIVAQVKATDRTETRLQIASACLQSKQAVPARKLIAKVLKESSASTAQTIDAQFLAATADRIEGRIEESLKRLESILSRSPHRLDVANNLAWLLAAHPDPQVRDSERAVLLAREAVEQTKGRVVPLLDTYAAALASDGEYEVAVQQADRAILQARSSGQYDLADAILFRRSLYVAHRPFLDADLRDPATNE